MSVRRRLAERILGAHGVVGDQSFSRALPAGEIAAIMQAPLDDEFATEQEYREYRELAAADAAPGGSGLYKRGGDAQAAAAARDAAARHTRRRRACPRPSARTG